VVLAVVALVAGSAAAQTTNTGRPPFASGMLQSISGSTLQVDSFNGTTSVVVTKSTKYSQTKSATTAAITTGACVRVAGTGSDSSGIQATTVAVTLSSSKGCTQQNAFGGAGAGGFGSGRFRGNGGNGGTNGGSGTNTTPRTLPNGGSLPNGGTRPANFGTAFGPVKSVSDSTITVKATVVVGTPKAGKKPKTKSENVTVTLTDTTMVTQTTNAALTDVTVGSCVTALGTADSVGTITANTVTVTQPQNGACGFGRGGFGGFGRGGFGGNGGNGGSGGNGSTGSNGQATT
jgi:hypothetical protein